MPDHVKNPGIGSRLMASLVPLLWQIGLPVGPSNQYCKAISCTAHQNLVYIRMGILTEFLRSERHTCYDLGESILVGGGDQSSGAADGGRADMERVMHLHLFTLISMQTVSGGQAAQSTACCMEGDGLFVERSGAACQEASHSGHIQCACFW